MVKLFGKSLLEWQLHIMRSCDINDISVVLGHMGDLVKFPDLTYFRNDRYDSTNMVETLFCAQEKLSGSVIVSYGDIVYEKKVLQKCCWKRSCWSGLGRSGSGNLKSVLKTLHAQFTPPLNRLWGNLDIGFFKKISP